MRYTIGLDIPDKEDQATTAISIIIPAISAFSAADTLGEIKPMARECIEGMLEIMKEDGIAPAADLGITHYSNAPEYSDYTFWTVVDVPDQEEL